MKAINWIATFVATASVMFTGCKSDDEATLSAAEIEAAQTTLNGDIVVSAHAWINGEDKTLLSSGAPIKLNFEKSDGDKMNVWMDAIQIGSMPFTVYFGIVIEFAPLNSWEKGELTDEGWVKFSGSHGNISYEPGLHHLLTQQQRATAAPWQAMSTQKPMRFSSRQASQP